ncbi:MAG: rRNA cytosine-C5-methyltransferase [Bacteroidales bacterium]
MNRVFPEEFAERVTSQEYINRDSLLAALSDDSPVSIRLNTAKWSSAPRSAQRVPWCDTGYYLPERPLFTLDPLFHAGCYYVQEASSMFLEVVFKSVGGDGEGLRILDMCASPGGKSTHLALLAGPGSILISNETVRSRLGALVENTIRWGASNTLISNNDPGDFERLPGYFDIILVDAPCSGEGMFRKQEVRSMWSTAGCDLCSDRQRRILKSAWECLRPGGKLIYSTCTFNPVENEDNVRWLTETHGAVTVSIDITQYEGIQEIGGRGWMGYGFHPGKIKGEGFFIAAVMKPLNEEEVESRRGWSVSRQTGRGVPSGISELLIRHNGSLILWGDRCFHLPGHGDEMSMLQKNLNLIRKGTEICSIKRNGIIPSHELSVSELLRGEAFPVIELSWSEAIRYLRRDSLPVKSEMAHGWCLVTYSGVRLGFVNNIGTRLNNYYPASYRIRMDAGRTEVRVLT